MNINNTANTAAVSIDREVFTANKTARTKKAISSLKASIALLTAAGLVVRIDAGKSGRKKVYIYDTPRTGNNSLTDALYVFDYCYQVGAWFRSNSAVQEALAAGLTMACEKLELVATAA